jgi:polynucleotide 5'-kinase involved in rRNA processing
MAFHRYRPCISLYTRLLYIVLHSHRTIAWVNYQSARILPFHCVGMATESNVEHEPEANAKDLTSTESIRVLGVGGGIGSGKSTACKLLANELGCIAHIGT